MAWMLPSDSICLSAAHCSEVAPGLVSYASTLTACAPAAFAHCILARHQYLGGQYLLTPLTAMKFQPLKPCYLLLSSLLPDKSCIPVTSMHKRQVIPEVGRSSYGQCKGVGDAKQTSKLARNLGTTGGSVRPPVTWGTGQSTAAPWLSPLLCSSRTRPCVLACSAPMCIKYASKG